MKNIVLVGISGSGKTSMGERLANHLSREFIDLDSLIQDREGLSIPKIFEMRGEGGFRRAETKAVEAISGRGGAVIACGGGIVIKDINMELLSQNSVIVFMNRSVKDILEGVDLNSRPLLRDTPEKLYEIHRDRLPLYEKYADFEVDCNKGMEYILEQLIRISELEQSDKRLAVIGEPIAHSLSPDIHIAVLQPFLKSVSYEKILVRQNDLSQWMTLTGRKDLDGFNVTMPHKESILSLLEGVNREAAELGSVNTVVNIDGNPWGYSTDGEGFYQALTYIGGGFKDSAVTIIGSGGAAVTLAMKAAQKGAKELHIIARDLAKAEDMLRKVTEHYEIKCYLHPFLAQSSDGIEWNSSIVINATPIGMAGIKQDFQNFDFLDQMKGDAILCDLIYSPAKTKLLIEGEKRGLLTLGGINMLIEQAIEADRLYIGADINRYKAYERIIENLKGKVEGI